MAGGDLQDKTEKATPRKLRDAREKGQVAKSREVSSVAVLLAGLSTLYLFGSFMCRRLQMLMERSFGMLATPQLEFGDFLALNRDVVGQFVLIMAPLMLAAAVVALLSNLLQVGVLFTAEPITPKFSRISPLSGLKRLFSKQSLVEFAKSLAKLIMVAGIAYWTVKGDAGRLRDLGHMEIASILVQILKMVLKLFLRVSVFMILLAIFDYAFQRWHLAQELKMTKQELREEYKRTEGDPLVKARIRRVQQEVARRRMMQEVPKADVVVTNPLHLALALRYTAAAMSAPRVVAKGAGKVAERIKAIAAEHHIPIVENKPLARKLYKLVGLGEEIPSEFYQAVAEVLAYVYRLKGKAA